MDRFSQEAITQEQVESLSAVSQSCWHRTTLYRPMAHMQPTSFGLKEGLLGHKKRLQEQGRPGSAGRDRGVHAGKVKGNED